MQDFSDFVGISLEDARERASDFGHSVRVTSINGVPQVCTSDFISGRLNVAVSCDEDSDELIVDKVFGRG